MICKYCGQQIQDGSIYCSSCGKETTIVSDYNSFEDDYLKKVLLEEENNKSMNAQQENIKEGTKQTTSQRNTSVASKQKDNSATKKNSSQKQKIILIAIIAAIVCVLIVLIIIFKYNADKSNESSFDYQVDCAKEALSDNREGDAIRFYKRALEIEEDNIEVRFELVKIYTEDQDYENAIYYLKQIIGIDPNNKEAYKQLIAIYDKQNDMDEIISLSEKIKDEDVLELFEDYIVLPPQFSDEPGTYKEYLSLILTASSDCDIYYTLDGSDPIEKGEKFSKVIRLDEMKTYKIRAVSINEKGIVSSEISGEYVIDIPNPDMPTVTPDGGTYNSLTSITILVPDGCTAYYTWDGSTPIPGSSAVYISSFPILEGTNVLSVIIVDNKTKLQSQVYKATFTYNPST